MKDIFCPRGGIGRHVWFRTTSQKGVGSNPTGDTKRPGDFLKFGIQILLSVRIKKPPKWRFNFS